MSRGRGTRPSRDQGNSAAKRTYWLCHFLRWLPLGVVMPVLALLPTERGLSTGQLGVLLGTYAAVTAVLELPTGSLADTMGYRPVLIAAAILETAWYLGFLLADTFGQFLAAVVCGGVGRALASGPLEAWFVDAAYQHDPRVDVRPAIGGALFLTNIAVLVGASFTAALPLLTDRADQATLSASALPFAAAAVAGVVNIAAIFVLMSRRSGQRDTVGSWARLRGAPALAVSSARLSVRVGPIRLLLIAGAAVGTGIGSVETFWQPHLAEMLPSSSAATTTFGLMTVASTVIGSLASLTAAKLPTRAACHAAAICTGLVALIGVAIAGLALAPTLPLTIAAFLAVYLFLELRAPLAQTLLHHAAPAGQRASVLSAYSMSTNSGAVFGAVALGAIADLSGIPAAWLIAGGIGICASPVYLRLRKHSEGLAPLGRVS